MAGKYQPGNTRYALAEGAVLQHSPTAPGARFPWNRKQIQHTVPHVSFQTHALYSGLPGLVKPVKNPCGESRKSTGALCPDRVTGLDIVCPDRVVGLDE